MGVYSYVCLAQTAILFHDWRAEGVSLYYDLLCIYAEICTSTLELCDKYEKDLTDK